MIWLISFPLKQQPMFFFDKSSIYIFKRIDDSISPDTINNSNIISPFDNNVYLVKHSYNLRQHVQERTHRHDHILDLFISRDDDNLIKSVSSMLSDDFPVNINVSLQKQSVSAKVISYRRYNSVDKEAFLPDLQVSSLVLSFNSLQGSYRHYLWYYYVTYYFYSAFEWLLLVTALY